MASYWNETSINAGSTYGVYEAITIYQLRVFGDVLPESWIQFFDAASTPAEGDVPVISCPMAEYLEIDFGTGGRRFSTGLSMAISATKMAYTPATSASVRFDAQCYSS